MNESSIQELLVEALRDLLRDGPKPGALLKPQLRRWYWERTGAEFDERKLGHPKFIDFLRAHRHVVEIAGEGQPGDVLVSLVSPERVERGLPRLSADVWRAFTNPDKMRKRFLDRETGKVIHYLADSDRDQDQRLASIVALSSRYVEIEAVPPQQQLDWMTRFVLSAEVLPTRREPLLQMLGTAYSSDLNGLFTDALGHAGLAYRIMRSEEVHAWAARWATQHGVSFALLTGESRKVHTAGVPESRAMNENPEPRDRSRRALLGEVLDQLSDDEIRSLLIPATLLLALKGDRR